MSYVDEGPRVDEAVVMLHGNPTWSFYFRELVQALSPVRRCVVPDHVGMGLSEKPAQLSYTLATRIEYLQALVAVLESKSFIWWFTTGAGQLASALPRVTRN